MNAPRRFFDGLLSVTAVRAALWLWTVGALWPGLFTDPHAVLPHMDAHHRAAWELADWMTIAHWHQLPLWNPWLCGGVPASAAPDDGVFAPDFLLRLVYGVEHGRRIAVALFAVLGMEGTYRFVRRVDGSAIGAVAAAVMLVFNDRTVGYLALGWFHFAALYLTPWVLLAVVAGRTSVSWRVAGGLALGWTALVAGTGIAPVVLLAGTYLTLALGISALLARPRPRWKAAKATVKGSLTIALLALVVALPKILPMNALVGGLAHAGGVAEGGDLTNVAQPDWLLRIVVYLLAMVAVLTGDRWGRVLAGGALLFLALGMGQYSDWELSALLRRLPLVDGLRSGERFTMTSMFFAALAAGRGITRIEDTIAGLFRGAGGLALRLVNRRRHERLVVRDRAGWSLVATALAGAFAAWLAYHALATPLKPVRINAHQLFTAPAPRELEQPFAQARGNRRDASTFVEMSRGTLACTADVKLSESPLLRGDLDAEEYPARPDEATVTRTLWSPNEIKLDVDAAAPTRVLVNQNWNRNWTTDVGAIVDHDRLLAIDVPAGKHEVTLRYHDLRTLLCLFVSVISMLGMLAYVARERTRAGARTLRAWRELGVFSPLGSVGEKSTAEAEPRRPKAEESKAERDGGSA